MSKLRTLFEQYEAVVLFDTETTGLDAKADKIIELAAIRVERTPAGGLRVAGKMDSFIRLPEGQTIPEKIVELTGITDEILQSEGVRPEKAADSFAKLLAGNRILVGAHTAAGQDQPERRAGSQRAREGVRLTVLPDLRDHNLRQRQRVRRRRRDRATTSRQGQAHGGLLLPPIPAERAGIQ